ncbi:LytR/AlgR family response regulator transcription factor [Lachnospira multipara]|uniref:LytR/AlgR family response regulator transcription factor n=1 Tax=Lachnospira multipara TaxID=28051 RepID=UPI00040A2FFE|nr:LytTR family DNA-binding domain-containing protein [Lachnospira multipara]
MNVAVCDDEKKTREQIVAMIKEQYSDAKLSCFTTAEEMIAGRGFFDICFLDIEMGSVSGIELAKRIRKVQGNSGKRSIIIFVTAFREYMEDAFDVNAFHYLVKPIKEKKFAEVFQRAVKEVVTGDERREKYILVKDGESKRKLLLREIQYIESSDRKVVFHMDNGLTETYARMYDLENELGDLFFRTHRCYIVNLEKVTAYSANSIQMLNGDSVMLAEKKYTDFVKTYLRYAKNGGIVNV